MTDSKLNKVVSVLSSESQFNPIRRKIVKQFNINPKIKQTVTEGVLPE